MSGGRKYILDVWEGYGLREGRGAEVQGHGEVLILEIGGWGLLDAG